MEKILKQDHIWSLYDIDSDSLLKIKVGNVLIIHSTSEEVADRELKEEPEGNVLVTQVGSDFIMAHRYSGEIKKFNRTYGVEIVSNIHSIPYYIGDVYEKEEDAPDFKLS